MDLMGQRIGGDMDDWVLQNLGIPSITNELGEENQYENGWVVTNRDTARNIVLENSNWLEFAYEKLGA